ncbi:radical SAM protein [Rhodopseudomonas sp. NSM]|uniref:radical SAM protein n=1 Tax=Rhodopseudomonas sp. NSM TaxID=3457630 RepID=UPI0040359F91
MIASKELIFRDGWHPIESNGDVAWRWSSKVAELAVPAAAGRYLLIDYARPEYFGDTDCRVAGPSADASLPIRLGRGKLLIDLAHLNARSGDLLHFDLSSPYRPEGDPRDLGLMVFNVDTPSSEAINRYKREVGLHELPLIADYTPSELTIAVSDKCNLRCVTCFAHHRQEGDNNANYDDFPPELIPRIKDAAMGASRIQIHGGAGEPLMARKFWDWFTLLDNNPGAKIEFNTNGLTFNAKNIERLLKYNVDHISVSFDAATPEIYAKIRGGDFDRLVSNMRSLVEQRKQNGNPIRVLFNMTVNKTNAVDAPKLVRLAHDIGVDGVELYHLNSGQGFNWTVVKNGHPFNYRENLPEHNQELIRRCIEQARATADKLGLYLFVDPRFQVTLYGRADEASSAMPEYRECRAPWHWLAMEVSGKVKPCCMATKPLANPHDASAMEIWNGPEMQRLRKNIKSNSLDPICIGASCRYVMKSTMAHTEADVPALQDDSRAHGGL